MRSALGAPVGPARPYGPDPASRVTDTTTTPDDTSTTPGGGDAGGNGRRRRRRRPPVDDPLPPSGPACLVGGGSGVRRSPKDMAAEFCVLFALYVFL